jgi:hypothetical protein
MSLTFLENIPDTIVRDDLVNYSQCKCNKDDFLNYKHIFNIIGEGNIFYPECYLYPNKEEINLYGGYCKNGYYNKLTYNIKEQKYFLSREENEIGKPIFNTKLWTEMYEYIHKYFYLNY